MAGGSSAKNKKGRNAAMAARLKEEDVRRTSGRCPICNGIIALTAYYTHVGFHKTPAPRMSHKRAFENVE